MSTKFLFAGPCIKNESISFPKGPSLDKKVELSIVKLASSPYVSANLPSSLSFLIASAIEDVALAIDPMFLGGLLGPVCLSLFGCGIATHLCSCVSNLNPAGQGSTAGVCVCG